MLSLVRLLPRIKPIEQNIKEVKSFSEIPEHFLPEFDISQLEISNKTNSELLTQILNYYHKEFKLNILSVDNSTISSELSEQYSSNELLVLCFLFNQYLANIMINLDLTFISTNEQYLFIISTTNYIYNISELWINNIYVNSFNLYSYHLNIILKKINSIVEEFKNNSIEETNNQIINKILNKIYQDTTNIKILITQYQYQKFYNDYYQALNRITKIQNIDSKCLIKLKQYQDEFNKTYKKINVKHIKISDTTIYLLNDNSIDDPISKKLYKFGGKEDIKLLNLIQYNIFIVLIQIIKSI